MAVEIYAVTAAAGGAVESGITNQHLYTAYLVKATHHGPDPKISKDRSGTGFVVSFAEGERRQFVLVTNRHILDLTWADRQFEGFRLSGVQLWTHAHSPTGPPTSVGPILAPPGAVRFHPDETVDIGGFTFEKCAQLPGGPLVIHNHVDESLLAGRDTFDNSVQAGELVFFPGYPAWFDHNGLRPILRTGAIVSDPRSDYRWSAGSPHHTDGNSQMLIDAFSTGGNSGSPVFVGARGFRAGAGLVYSGEARDAQLVGINAGHIRDENNQHVGLSRVYKSYEIARFVESFKVGD